MGAGKKRHMAALAVVGCFGCGGGNRQMPPSAPSPLSSHPVPDFERRAVDGSSIDTKQLRGKVVVVKFFAKYCEPCRRTLPAAEQLHRQDAGIAFIGIDEDERPSDVRSMIDQYQLTFPVIHDSSNTLSGRFRVTSLPTTFVIDKLGVVKWIAGPDQNENDLSTATSLMNR